MLQVMEVLGKVKMDGKKGFVLGLLVLLIVVIDQFFYPALLPDDKNLWEIPLMQSIFFFFLVILKSDVKKIVQEKNSKF